MRINILQHTPNEGPGAIRAWAQHHDHQLYIYHPYQFGVLPNASETDLLIILGGPMSPNDHTPWIIEERQLITALMEKNKPIFGACYGAQQIAKTLGANIIRAPHKEVGWAAVYRQNNVIPGVPPQLTALHWHEEMFELPETAQLLFSSELVPNQGFLVKKNIVGLQFHFEPQADDIREIALNDYAYPENNNALQQTAADIMATAVPTENREVLFAILDFITQ